MDETTLKRLFIIGLQFEHSFGILGNVAISKAAPNSRSLPVAAHAPAIPSVVCGAFALELQLKCLVAIETGREPPRGHDLREIFALTSDSSQESIQQTYSRLLDEAPDLTGQYKDAGISLDFDDVLDDCKDAFIEWRYHHEFEKRKSWMASPILKAVRDEILKLRPNWNTVFDQ